MLDVGCGNGKYLDTNTNINTAIDFCYGLCDIARLRNCADLCNADAMNLPFKTNNFDFAISIAVIHHLSTASRRL